MRLLKSVSALIIMMGIWLPAASVQTPPAALSDFEIVMAFGVKIDGQDQTSVRLYQSFRPPSFLITGDAVASAAVLIPQGNQVRSLDKRFVQIDPDGHARILEGYVLSPSQGEYRVSNEQEVEFQFGDGAIRLAPKPWLLGLQDAKSIAAYDEVYHARARHYNPDPNVLAQLKRRTDRVRVRVYFGSWCRHCQTHVPSFLSLERLLHGTPIRFEYYGLPRGRPDPQMPPEVKRLPTAIVHVDGHRVGLFTDHDVETPEIGLAKVLSGH